MPPRITSGEIKWCRRENRPPALNEKAVRCTRFLPLSPSFASREANECTGRQNNAGTVYIAKWTEERDEARVEKNEKKEVQQIRKPSQVLAFLSDPFAFILAFVLQPNPYKEDEQEDEQEGREY